jgi:4-hydroxy 2-oxovalerate aldolase
VLLVPGIGTADDLRRAREAGADVVRVATHCTEADVSPEHFALARELGMETVGFLMMAHRTSPRSWPSRPGSWSTPAASARTSPTPRVRC